MRYPVGDEFAIRLAGELHRRILGAGNSVDAAVRLAVPAAAGPAPSPAAPPAALVTPVLLGRTAVGLTLPAPDGKLNLTDESAKTAYLRPEPDRFVGRGAAMARASAALAPGSGRTGVLFHGMAGAGKTACALELAYRHTDAFAAIAYWETPQTPDEYNAALPDLAAALEQQLPGLRIVDKISPAERMRDTVGPRHVIEHDVGTAGHTRPVPTSSRTGQAYGRTTRTDDTGDVPACGSRPNRAGHVRWPRDTDAPGNVYRSRK